MSLKLKQLGTQRDFEGSSEEMPGWRRKFTCTR